MMLVSDVDDDERGRISILRLFVVLGAGINDGLCWRYECTCAVYIRFERFLTSPEGEWRLCEARDKCEGTGIR